MAKNAPISMAPKRPCTAFTLFVQSAREGARQEFPQLGFTDLAKILANRWKDMGDAEKSHFSARADADHQRYLLELQAFKQAQPKKPLSQPSFGSVSQTPSKSGLSAESCSDRAPAPLDFPFMLIYASLSARISSEKLAAISQRLTHDRRMFEAFHVAELTNDLEDLENTLDIILSLSSPADRQCRK